MNHFKLFLEDAAVPVNNIGSGNIELTAKPSDDIHKRKLPDDKNPEDAVKEVDPTNNDELQQKFFRDQKVDKNLP